MPTQYNKLRNKEKWISAIAILLALSMLSIYLYFSWSWYRERMFHFDAAFYLFKVIHHDGFQLFHDRYINALTQWIPLGVHLIGADLVTTARAYSLSLPMIHVGVMAGLYFWRRDPFLPLLFLLVVLSPIRYRFFSPISETHFVLIFGFLYFIITQNDPGEREYLRASLATILLAAISHPVSVFALLALWSVAWITRPGFIRNRLVELTLIVLLYGWRLTLTLSNPYESGKLGILGQVMELPGKWKELVIPELLGEYVLNWHSVQWGVFLVSLVWLWTLGKRSLVFFSLGFALAVLVLVLVTFSYLSFPEYHMMEGYLSFISLAWMIPIYFIWQEDQCKALCLSLLAASLIWSMVGICGVRKYYIKREQYLTELYRPWQAKGNKRLVLSPYEFPWRTLWFSWSVPFETMLMSASRSRSEAVTVYIPDDLEELKEAERISDQFFGAWKSYPVESLDPAYFQMPRQPYLNITGAGLPRDFDE